MVPQVLLLLLALKKYARVMFICLRSYLTPSAFVHLGNELT